MGRFLIFCYVCMWSLGFRGFLIVGVYTYHIGGLRCIYLQYPWVAFTVFCV